MTSVTADHKLFAQPFLSFVESAKKEGIKAVENDDDAKYAYRTISPVFLVWDVPQPHPKSNAEWDRDDGLPFQQLERFLVSVVERLEDGTVLVPPPEVSQEEIQASGYRWFVLRRSGYVLQVRQRYCANLGIPVPRKSWFDGFITLDIDGRPVMDKSGAVVFEFTFVIGEPREEEDGTQE